MVEGLRVCASDCGGKRFKRLHKAKLTIPPVRIDSNSCKVFGTIQSCLLRLAVFKVIREPHPIHSWSTSSSHMSYNLDSMKGCYIENSMREHCRVNSRGY